MNNPFRYGPTTPQMYNQLNQNQYTQQQASFDSMTQNNFNKAYEQNKPLIDPTDFKNKNNVLHNNLNDDLLHERIVEYNVIIHSKDRNKTQFPSPFYLKTSFGNTNNTPNVTLDLTNVKYVTLNTVTVPRTVSIDTSEIDLNSGITKITPTDSFITGTPPTNNSPSWLLDNLSAHPYLILRVKELDDKHMLGSSPLYQPGTFTFAQL